MARDAGPPPLTWPCVSLPWTRADEARNELKATRKAAARAKAEHAGKLAQLEARAERDVTEARDAASAAALADQNRLTKLASDHLRSLHAADELATHLKRELESLQKDAARHKGEVARAEAGQRVLAAEMAQLETLCARATAHELFDVERARKQASIATQAAAAAEGRAAAAELELMRVRARLLAADEKAASREREVAAAASAAKEAHMSTLQDARDEAARERERHAEVLDSLRSELQASRQSNAEAMSRAEEVTHGPRDAPTLMAADCAPLTP